MDQRMIVQFLALIGLCYSLAVPAGLAATTGVYEKSFGREDKTLFGKHCGVCHSMGGGWKKPGPPLNGLFERKQLVTGKPVTEESVREVIMKGGPKLMPGFQYMLASDQIDEVVHFLKSAVCPEAPAVEQKKNEKENE